MKNIKVEGLHFQLFIPLDKIKKRIFDISDLVKQKCESDYVFLIVLNGASVFAEEFLKFFASETPWSVVKVRSYSGIHNTGKIVLDYIRYDFVKNKKVFLIEDIVDTGYTLNFLKKKMINNGALSVECITLLFKPSKYLFQEAPEYIGFSIGDEFVLGFGMDVNQKGRELKDIYKHVEI